MLYAIYFILLFVKTWSFLFYISFNFDELTIMYNV